MMPTNKQIADPDLPLVERWCAKRGNGWTVHRVLGSGATATVYELETPDGQRALKLYNPKFCVDELGGVERKRIEQQVALGGHGCKNLVDIYGGDEFDGRLMLLMGRPPGQELAKRLHDVPRPKIRSIVDQVARAVAFLRERHVCHRDIKAANIIVSDDFEHATLLDLSVTRNIHDPVGVGTDHGGHLPIVATARYCPPEYLFRLVEPSPELWHALDIYQLGALLHDLIMKQGLFEAEYQRSKENRYRFAWIVATVNPLIQSSDVDQDLVFTAQRALAKDWQLRSAMELDDFFAETARREANALDRLGIGMSRAKHTEPPLRHLQQGGRLTDICNHVKTECARRLLDRDIRTIHKLAPMRGDRERVITFRWNMKADPPLLRSESRELRVKLALDYLGNHPSVQCDATLVAQLGDQNREAHIALGNMPDEFGLEERIVDHVMSALGTLAKGIIQAQ